MKAQILNNRTKLAVAIISLLALFANTQISSGTIKGTIKQTKTEVVIPLARIQVMQKSIQIKETKSDAKGNFSVIVPVGSYELTISAKGYNSTKMNVYISDNQTLTLFPKLDKSPQVVQNNNQKSVTRSVELKKAEAPMPIMMEDEIEMSVNMAYSTAAPSEKISMKNDKDFNTEAYSHIQENIFKDAKVSPISTFSVDVDRAAYANVRRFLNQNQKPYADAVRIEEMINYFTYNYPQPTDGTPFSINMESQICPWNTNHRLVLVGLQGEEIEQSKIPANNLVFLLDVSGSMDNPEKLGLLKQAFAELITKLRPQDCVSIVVYAGAAGVILEPTGGDEKGKILAALENLQAGGSTAGGEGIELAYKMAKEHFVHGGNNRVILATDGDFNVGASSDGEMVRLIESKRDDGIYLTILGFGMGNYKDSKMEEISNAGNGNYAYIDNLLEAKKIFGKELWGTLYTIAKDVKIQIEFNPAVVASYRLIGYENRMLQTEDFNNDKKDAGDIGSGHTVTALYEIELVNNETPKPQDSKYIKQTYTNSSDLMTVNIRYKKPTETTSLLITKTVTKDGLSKGNNIEFAACVAQFGMILRDSEFKGTSSFAQVLETANKLESQDEWGYRKEFVGLVEKANVLYQ